MELLSVIVNNHFQHHLNTKRDGTVQLFGTKEQKFLHCLGTKGQRDRSSFIVPGQRSLSRYFCTCPCPGTKGQRDREIKIKKHKFTYILSSLIKYSQVNLGFWPQGTTPFFVSRFTRFFLGIIRFPAVFSFKLPDAVFSFNLPDLILNICKSDFYFKVQQGLEIHCFWFQKKTVQRKTVLREVFTYVLKWIFQKTVYLQGFWPKSLYLKATVM